MDTEDAYPATTAWKKELGLELGNIDVVHTTDNTKYLKTNFYGYI